MAAGGLSAYVPLSSTTATTTTAITTRSTNTSTHDSTLTPTSSNRKDSGQVNVAFAESNPTSATATLLPTSQRSFKKSIFPPLLSLGGDTHNNSAHLSPASEFTSSDNYSSATEFAPIDSTDPKKLKRRNKVIILKF